ncbi:hypothetical protein K227x_27430 [Rubripirellula lacrimiformis]|uniref:Uncharacterized protein n=1 Tax=Rubripirellula lacrimiformis TaxID=1930273 RepID=A0A517NB44_9BACT|nr:hypothetical protein [Rubripirellula lacrimiformis]QDT04352.1 hypothetical protein K227x_27430 [Rubripirellula lacrimiformis]
MAFSQELEENNAAEISFWVVVTEDQPSDYNAGVFPLAGVYPRVFADEMDAEAVAQRYRRAGYHTAEARLCEMDARSMIQCCDDTARTIG